MIYETGSIIAEKYRIIAYLGKTETGEMYRVIRNDQKAERLLKVILKNESGLGTSKVSSLLSRYTLETQLSSQLHSPTINPFLVQVFECLETDTSVMLEMEFAPGGSLYDRLQLYKNKSIRLEREKAIKIAMEIATGLARMHDMGIIHRNLIPANILFNQYDQAKIAGYGQAQISNGPSLRSPFTNPNQHPGTPGYMSPEQRISFERLSPSSDIFSLGLILFEMLTNQNYLDFHPRTRVSDLIPGVKPSLNDIVARMLSEFPDDRPRDGREAANELHREFIAEELAQREAQAKKRRELEEWERLKNEELSRQSGERFSNQSFAKPEKISSGSALSADAEKTRPREADVNRTVQNDSPQIANGYDQTGEPGTSQTENKLPLVEEKAKSPVGIFHGFKKFWWVGIPVILALVVIPILLNKPSGPASVNSTQGVAVVLPTLIYTPTSKNVTPAVALQPTYDLTQPARIATEIVQSITQASGPNRTDTVSGPRNEETTIPIPVNIMRDASFENGEGWELKVGDYHIQGQISDDWASQGKQSYQISLVGDRKYEYCFTPGMRTTANQSVDLTNVKAIRFDLNIRPAVYSGTSHGDNSKPRAVVFVDGDPLFTIPENTFGEKFDQRIELTGRYSGKHDVKLGLMVMSKLCVKSVLDSEKFLVYFDNIRLDY